MLKNPIVDFGNFNESQGMKKSSLLLFFQGWEFIGDLRALATDWKDTHKEREEEGKKKKS